MLFVVRFSDKSNAQPIREQHLATHVAWLDQRRQSVLVAGSVREEPDSFPIGAFWVVEAANKEELEKLYQSDPYWVNGLREHVEILHWSKAFPDEKALV